MGVLGAEEGREEVERQVGERGKGTGGSLMHNTNYSVVYLAEEVRDGEVHAPFPLRE
jgi:hypothetical protein